MVAIFLHLFELSCSSGPLIARSELTADIAVLAQIWRCKVDIAAVAATCSDWPLLLGFLQRRQPIQHPNSDIRAMLLTITKVQAAH